MSPIGLGILSFVVVLGVLVFVHELGHFLAAKAAGIYVHRFSIGMGPPIKALSFHRGETEYVISWLPLGGYVKMASREEDPGAVLEGGPAGVEVPPDRVMEAKPIWVRMVVMLAGVTMNALFAWLLFSGLTYANGVTVIPTTVVGRVYPASLPPGAEEITRLQAGDRITRVAGKPVTSWQDIQDGFLTTPADSFAVEVEGKPPVTIRIHRDALEARLRAQDAVFPFIIPVIGQVVPGQPGAKAGLRLGDTLVAIEGEPVSQREDAVDLIERHPDQDVRLTVGRPEGRIELMAHTIAETVKDSAGARRVGKLRIGFATPLRHEPATFGEAVVSGAKQTVAGSTQIVRVVRGMFSGRVSTREVGGPISIGMAAGQAAQLGVSVFLGFMALISINLAVLNLLPIPVLDGGQVLFLLGEAVLRRPLSVKLRERLTVVGLVLIGMLTILAFSNDIRRLLGV